jgi:hypothetical protein
VTTDTNANQVMLQCEGLKEGNEGITLFNEAEASSRSAKSASGGGSIITDAIAGITQLTAADCSSALCMSPYIDFWRETDSRGLLPWNLTDCSLVHGGTPASKSSVPIGISGGVQLALRCTLADYLVRKPPPSPGAALLLLQRVVLMLQALHASSIVAVGLCSAAIVCVRPRHPDEYYEGVLGSDLFESSAERQRWKCDVWCVVCGVRCVIYDIYIQLIMRYM